MKTCLSCKILKDLIEFYKNKAGKDGRQAHCKICANIKLKEYRLKHKTIFNARIRDWQKRNRSRVNANNIKYQNKNKDAVLKYGKEYRNRPESKKLRTILQKNRDINKKQRIPLWADLDKIKEFYKNCPKGYHVDHIIPLQGKEVCGLHVENNLQYLTAKENLMKNNKFDLIVKVKNE